MGENNNAYRVVGLQTAVTITSTALVYFIGSPLLAVAVLWGGFTSAANGMLLAWRMLGGRHAAHHDVHRHLWLMYRSSLERFFVVIALLALGMGQLKLVPLAVLGGFVAGQVTLVIARLLLSR